MLAFKTLKTTRLGYHLPPELKTIKGSKLCAVAYLKQYIELAAPFRNTGTNQLLLSLVQQHKPISTTNLQGGVYMQ